MLQSLQKSLKRKFRISRSLKAVKFLTNYLSQMIQKLRHHHHHQKGPEALEAVDASRWKSNVSNVIVAENIFFRNKRWGFTFVCTWKKVHSFAIPVALTTTPGTVWRSTFAEKRDDSGLKSTTGLVIIATAASVTLISRTWTQNRRIPAKKKIRLTRSGFSAGAATREWRRTGLTVTWSITAKSNGGARFVTEKWQLSALSSSTWRHTQETNRISARNALNRLSS